MRRTRAALPTTPSKRARSSSSRMWGQYRRLLPKLRRQPFGLQALADEVEAALSTLHPPRAPTRSPGRTGPSRSAATPRDGRRQRHPRLVLRRRTVPRRRRGDRARPPPRRRGSPPHRCRRRIDPAGRRPRRLRRRSSDGSPRSIQALACRRERPDLGRHAPCGDGAPGRRGGGRPRERRDGPGRSRDAGRRPRDRRRGDRHAHARDPGDDGVADPVHGPSGRGLRGARPRDGAGRGRRDRLGEAPRRPRPRVREDRPAEPRAARAPRRAAARLPGGVGGRGSRSWLGARERPGRRPLEASVAAAVVAALQGAHIVRAHDVRPTCGRSRSSCASRPGP